MTIKYFFTLILISGAIASASAQSAGTLIPGFGNDGKVITAIGNYLCAQRTVIDNNGKILVLARINLNPSNLALSRYLPNGDLDPTFGSNGTVVTPVKSGLLVDLALQPDGKILVNGEETTFPSGLLVARYLTNGTLDPAFGNQGIFKSAVSPSRGYAVALTTDEKIVSAGNAFNSATQNQDIFLTRILPNGTVDASFGNNGTITHNFGSSEFVFEMAIQPDGKIVVFGKSNILPTYAVFRFLSNGMADINFGTNGRVVLSQIAPVTWGDMRLQNDGKIVLGGTADDGSGEYQFWAARLLANGSPDPTFGQNGTVKTNFDGNLKGEALMIDLQGRYIVGGDLQLPGQLTQMALTRFTAQGTVDSGFGTNGLARIEFGTGLNESCTDMAQLGNGNIIALGCALSFPQAKTIIAGLSPGSTTDVNQPEADAAPLLEYFPNPAGEWLYFRGHLDANTRITLTDSRGKLLQQPEAGDGKISVAGLPAGLYYLVIDTRKARYAYPVSVQR